MVSLFVYTFYLFNTLLHHAQSSGQDDGDDMCC